ncbi:MAG: IclR family transcriptional regulator [Pseudomonadota bacterium]
MAQQHVSAVDRALTILEASAAAGEALSLAELSARTGFYKSTILRLCGSLQQRGYLVREPDGRFRLGSGVLRLGALYREAYPAAERVRPLLARLVDETGETASFYVREGAARLCLYRANSPREIRHHLEEGARLPLDAGAAGRLLLAFGDPEWTAGSDIRQAGHCISLGERDPEIAAVAVPVFDLDARLTGTLAVSGLLGHFDVAFQARCLSALRRAAGALSPGSQA